VAHCAVTVAIAALLSLFAVLPASADSALPHLRANVQRVFTALGNRTLDRGDERRRVIHRLNQELFDWPEMAQRLLGSVWEQRTDAERTRFIGLLAGMVDAHVLALAPAGVEQIVWDGETIDDRHAAVRTTVMMKRGERLALEYRMTRRDDGWRIYDVALADVSLIESYRAQMQQIMKTSSYDGLIARLSGAR
jgi:phospholipid transport system substrate-binding protein